MKRTVFVILTAVTLIVAGILFINAIFNSSGADGLYFFKGTGNILRLKQSLGGLQCSEESFEDGVTRFHEAFFKNGELIIISKVSTPGMEHGLADFLAPSKTIPGDWDLVGMNSVWGENVYKSLLDAEVRRVEYPLKSALHRISDQPWIVKYYRKLRDKDHPAADLTLAERKYKPESADPYLAQIYFKALVFHAEWERLEDEMESAADLIAEAENPFLKEHFFMLDTTLKSRKASLENQNAWDDYVMLSNIAGSNHKFLEIMERMAGRDVFLPIYVSTGKNEYQFPGFLTGQVLAKVTRINAEFEMIRGNREQALHYLFVDYRFSQHLEHYDSLIGLLISTAIRSIIANSMHVYIDNACVTPRDAEGFYTLLKDLRKSDRNMPRNPQDFRKEFVFVLTENIRHLDELVIRWRVTEARVRALLIGAGARHFFLTGGAFPKSPEDFTLLQTDEFPRDPFDENPMRFLERDDVFFIYSIGPDETDDRAAFAYDPTNGTVSPGEIFYEFRKERRYPFPEKGMLAVTKPDLEKQFPNGLPHDSFHDERGASYTIVPEHPAKIISFGPDTDSLRVHKGELLPLHPQYDPTNGLISRGELILNTGEITEIPDL